MKTEHDILEQIAVELDAKADDLFTDIAKGMTPDSEDDDGYYEREAQAYRRAAEIVRHQIECEA